jgi:hypothetical protein
LRQPLAHLPDDVGRPRHVGSVIKNGIAQKNDVAYGDIVPHKGRDPTFCRTMASSGGTLLTTTTRDTEQRAAR